MRLIGWILIICGLIDTDWTLVWIGVIILLLFPKDDED